MKIYVKHIHTMYPDILTVEQEVLSSNLPQDMFCPLLPNRCIFPEAMQLRYRNTGGPGIAPAIFPGLEGGSRERTAWGTLT
jgi:hypothetical protein